MTDNKPARRSYDDLRDRRAFQTRHIGPTPTDVTEMLAAVGVADMDELIDRTVPHDVRQREPMKLPKLGPRQTDYDELREMARANRKVVSMLGMGYHQTITPAVIRRNVFENPGWYTAYTPYQPEISQGRLEALLNFQTMVCELTAMDLANASLLDESTAAAEAMTLLHRVGRGRKGDRFVVDEACHPQTIAVVATRAEPIGLEVVGGDPTTVDLDGVYGLLVQYPGTTGAIPDLRSIIERAHASDTLVAVAADPLALCVLTPPGEMGADVVLGSTQRFGVPIGFGGPHAAYLAVREEYPAVPSGASRGRVAGLSRAPGAAVGAADTRAAHPPREGDLQHLHLAGAAGCDGVDVRHPPRARGAGQDRAAGQPRGRHPGRGSAGERRRDRPRRVLRHGVHPDARPRRQGHRGCPGWGCEPAPR